MNSWYSHGITPDRAAEYSGFRGTITSNKLDSDDRGLELAVILSHGEVTCVSLSAEDVMGILKASDCRFCDDLNGKSVIVLYSTNNLFMLKQFPEVIGISVL